MLASTTRYTDGCSETPQAWLLAHLRHEVDSIRARQDAAQANGPCHQVAGEAAETLHAAFFVFTADGVRQQLLAEGQILWGRFFWEGWDNGQVSFENVLFETGSS